MSNLEIWDKVKSPDPKYTKTFSRAGGFRGTATNTQYQVLAATKLFGPNGIGWGYEITDEKYVEGAPIADNAKEIIHVVRGRVWYMHGGEKRYTSEQYGQTQFVGKNKHGAFTDEEAPKKSVSDMLLKCLALLGFSADIFLGLYDDNKYVNDMKVKAEQEGGNFTPPKEKVSQAQLSTLRDFLMQSKTVTESALCTVSRIAKLEDLEAARYEGAVKWLNQEIGKEHAGA